MSVQDTPNEKIDLATVVFSALSNHNKKCASAFLRSFHVIENESVQTQMLRMNRFWRDQLGRVDESTGEIRACLVDQCELKDWIRIFQQKVAGAVCRLPLPIFAK